MKSSRLWTGESCRNVHPILPGLRDPNAPMPTWTDFLRGRERSVPARPLPSVNPLDAWRRSPGSGLRATWLGHSTVLLEIDGVRVLTDPVWGPRASPFRLAGPKRFQRVPAAPSQHFSGRTAKTRNTTLWSSFIVRSERHGVFFSGDTGLTTQYEDI